MTPSKLGAVAAFRRENSLPTAGFRTVLAKDGLVVRYECTGDPSADLFTVMQATTSVQHAAITLATTTGVGSSFTEDPDFNPGDTFALQPGPESPPGEGTAVYSTPDGRVLTLNYGWFVNPCFAHGVAIEG